MLSSDRKCICKICDCGRHKCPHKDNCTGPWDKETRSEYCNQYQIHDICRPQTCKPPVSTMNNNDPLSNMTTNRADFVAHDVQSPQKFEKPGYEPPEGIMDARSVYQQEFTEKPQCAVRPVKPIHSILDNGKFDSNTTNRSHYIPWDVCAPERKARDKYEPSTDPFIGMPSYRADYIQHNPQKAQSCKPPVTCVASDSPFVNTSDYRYNFVSHNIEARQPLNHQAYIKPDAPFDGMTTNRQDYIAQGSCKPDSCRPPTHRVDCNQPFSSSTTNRSDYVTHDTKCVEKHDREKYVKPEGDMDLQSTYNSDFINQPNSRVHPIKPPQSAMNCEPFDGNTSYRQNYRNWDQPANIVQHREKYNPPEARFDSDTTNKMSYIAHNVDKPASCKPPVPKLEQLPFDGQTNYRTDFIQRDRGRCPAEQLSRNARSVSPEGYLYDGEDCDGHVHYVKSFPMVNTCNDYAPLAT